MLSQLSVDRFLSEKPLALTVAGLEELRGHILARLAVFDAEPNPTLEALVKEQQEKQATRAKGRGIGVIQIRGTISQHASGDLSALLMGGTATDQVSAQLAEFMADDDIAKIVLDIDSPGGTTFGLTELAAEIRAAREQKHIVSIANSLEASAAYWIGSAASESYVTPGGLVGSIGVFAIHQDISKLAENEGVKTTLISAGKYKTTGNEFEPLEDDARARIQARVDDAYAAFIHDVALGRGLPDSVVRNGFGEGDVLTAKAAKAAGMVDGVATFDQVLRRRRAPAVAALAEQELDSDTNEREAEQAAEREAELMRFGQLQWRVLQDRAARTVVEV